MTRQAKPKQTQQAKRWFWFSFYSPIPHTKRRGKQPFWSWCSGETLSEPTYFTICCLAEDVPNEAAMWKMAKAWFPITRKRFCKEVERGYNPNAGGRFPGYIPPKEFTP